LSVLHSGGKGKGNTKKGIYRKSKKRCFFTYLSWNQTITNLFCFPWKKGLLRCGWFSWGVIDWDDQSETVLNPVPVLAGWM
jgi:hypothetical protein